MKFWSASGIFINSLIGSTESMIISAITRSNVVLPDYQPSIYAATDFLLSGVSATLSFCSWRAWSNDNKWSPRQMLTSLFTKQATYVVSLGINTIVKVIDPDAGISSIISGPIATTMVAGLVSLIAKNHHRFFSCQKNNESKGKEKPIIYLIPHNNIENQKTPCCSII